MPRNGSGGYLPPQNSWNPAINGQQALPNDWQAILDDIAATLQASLAADGQTPVNGVMNFQNNRISNVGAPTGSGDALRWEQLTKGPDIPSASTIAIPVEGMLFDVTGTTTITSIQDRFPGRTAYLRFADAVQIVNSANLKVPTGSDRTTSAGDVICVVNTEPGVWEIVSGLLGSAAYVDAIGTAPLYGRDSVVGTVSQSGGVPTGAAWQVISNANGIALRNAAGIQICFASESRSLTVSSAVSGGYYTFTEWTLPAPFANGVFASAEFQTSGQVTSGMPADAAALFTDSVGFHAFANNSRSSLTYRCRFLAVGYWI